MLKQENIGSVKVRLIETESECGFLSNQEEAEKLNTPEYQEKTAWAIHMGILQYLNTQ